MCGDKQLQSQPWGSRVEQIAVKICQFSVHSKSQNSYRRSLLKKQTKKQTKHLIRTITTFLISENTHDSPVYKFISPRHN